MVLQEAVALVRRRGGNVLRSALAGDEQLRPHELATKDDPGLFGPQSVAWRVHGETSMIIGGLRALMLQTLHPLAMAGVAGHSDYREDPWGRLHRTGRFIGATTYGNTKTAEQIIQVVRRVHDRVHGEAPDGRPYSAQDPHLLLWVHITEVDSFLRGYDRYGIGKLTDAERDRYIAEMSEVAVRLGCDEGAVPQSRLEMRDCLEAFRTECTYGDQAKESMKFLLNPPVPLVAKGAYGLTSAAAVGLLPNWAQTMLRLPVPPGLDPLAIRPAATVLTRGIGWLMTDDRSRDLEDRFLS